ncbi:MAG: radical SAM protein [Lachnospiraceae bacterium]|nr:radical SAM protein [Ruminococcus sp.]MCM1274497.1 radical SAM protein [Lachnospiraceae bacterium]
MGRVIVWRITRDCNMKCKFCPYSAEVGSVCADEAEVERLCAVLGEYRRLTGEDILVRWTGGEPFLWGNIIPFSERLRGYGIGAGAVTNGLPLNKKELRNGVVSCFSELAFGLDGFAECDDAVRQYFGHFDAASRNIKALADMRDERMSGLRLKVNTVLMRRNIARFEEFCEYLLWLGVDELVFGRLDCPDKPDERQEETFAKRLPTLQKDFAERGFIIRGKEEPDAFINESGVGWLPSGGSFEIKDAEDLKRVFE